jgi:hypothetical protein
VVTIHTYAMQYSQVFKHGCILHTSIAIKVTLTTKKEETDREPIYMKYKYRIPSLS